MKLADISTPSEFPKFSDKLPGIIDAIALKQYSAIALKKLEIAFGFRNIVEGGEFIGDEFYSAEREFEDFINIVIRLKNPFAVNELIRSVYIIDQVAIRDEMLEEYNMFRSKLNSLLKTLFDSDSWMNFENWCRSNVSTHLAREFAEYCNKSKENYRTITSNHIRKSIDARYENKDLELADMKPSASDFVSLIHLAYETENLEYLLELLNIHLDPALISAYSNIEKDYTTRQNLELIIKYIEDLSPTALDRRAVGWHQLNQKISHESLVAEHMLAVVAFVRRDLDSLYSRVISILNIKTVGNELTITSSQAGYLVGLVAQLLEVKCNICNKDEVLQFVRAQILRLQPEDSHRVLVNYYHPMLFDKALEAFNHLFDGNYFQLEEASHIFMNLYKNTTKENQLRLRDHFKKLIQKEAERLDAVVFEESQGLDGSLEVPEDEDVKDKRKKSIPAYRGERLSFLIDIAIEFEDIDMLKELFEWGLSYMGKGTSISRLNRESTTKAVNYLFRKADHMYIYYIMARLLDNYHNGLTILASKEYVVRGSDGIESIIDSIPVLLSATAAFAEKFPNEIVSITVGNDDRLELNPAIISKEIIEYIEWMSRGIKIHYEEYGIISHSISEFLAIVRIVLEHNHDGVHAVLKIKQIVVSEVKRLISEGSYNAAHYYIKTIADYINNPAINDSVFLELSQTPNLSWITDLILPKNINSSVSLN